MSTLSYPRVDAARRGENPTVICRMPSGWAVLCDWQYLPGYSLLLSDPVVSDLHVLPMEERLRFLQDMAILGEAIVEVTKPLRINYQILGNLDTFLHAHVCPRYEWEDKDRLCRPTAFYDKKAEPRFDPVQHGSLQAQLASAINRLLQQTNSDNV